MWAFLCGWYLPVPARYYGWSLLAGIALTGPLVCGASQVVNDWYDRDVDALNEPIAHSLGRVPSDGALVCHALDSGGAKLGADARAEPRHLVGLLLAWAYSAPRCDSN